MRVSKKILIEETDVSSLHAELTDLLLLFVDNSASVEPGDEWVKREFPNLMKLHRLLDNTVMKEPGSQINDRLDKLIKDQEGEAPARLKNRLRMVHSVD